MPVQYNPANVMIGQPSKPGAAYVSLSSNGPSGTPAPGINPQQGPAAPQLPSTVVGPQAVRATGSGPFDAQYRQNLATFAGGLFGSQNGNLSFNPTSGNPFGGQATGGGNAPVFGIPNTQLQNALGGQPFSYTPPPATPTTTNSSNPVQSISQFLQNFGNNNLFGNQPQDNQP